MKSVPEVAPQTTNTADESLSEEEIMAKLKKLKSLFEKELIDEAEYKQKKAELISLL